MGGFDLKIIMAKSKKTPVRKSTTRPKNKTAHKPKGSGIAKKVAAATPKLAKPNLQPARIIRRPDHPPLEESNHNVPVSPLEAPNNSQTHVEEAPAKEQTTKVAMPVEPVVEEVPKKEAEPPKESNKPAETQLAEDKIISAEPLESSISSAENPSQANSIQRPHSVKKLRRRLARRVLVAVSILVLLGVSGVVIFHRSSPNQDEATRQLVAEVSKRVVVPSDETPTVTTVVDETQISQDFLRGTKKGDKVLLYFQAGRAVVYRPTSDQVVNMGPIETPKPRVFLRSGSSADKVTAMADKLSKSPDFLLVSRDASPKPSYEKTTVIDVTGVRPDVAAKLATYLGATVGTLPDGESKPDADLLVIVGRD
ncbi:MAG: hypothetical protein JWP13_811 [Candidatus Saccharibacteria bacterium]|nr:hypothetical protein [Candidatus Saccharibacteria bacterium]